MEILSSSTTDTKNLARRIAKVLKPQDVLALYGDLGTGKTIFTKFLVEALGLDSRVQSPTFVILRKYLGGKGKIKVVNHFDLYRITNTKEVFDLGLSEIFDEDNAISIIEWPKLIEEHLPKDAIKIRFDYVSENERKITIQNLNRQF